MSFTNILNKRGLKLHPCLKPTSELKNGVIPFDNFTVICRSSYIELIKETNLKLKPFKISL